MNKSEIEQNILMGLVVLAMLGALWFLYDKTQSVDLQEQNEVMGLLNDVKEIDSRWDMEVQRARIDLSSQAALFVRAGLAASNGEERARRNRNMVERLMKPEQIAEAKRRADEWMKAHAKR